MKIRIVERAKKTVGKEISSQMKKGKPHDQAVAIAMSKKEKGEIIAENFDAGYLKQQGLTIGKELGKGMFGVVYSVTGNVGGKKGEYALKYVDSSSKGYSREKSNYQNVKQFVDLANIRQDAEAMRLGKILPIIYSVSEHGGGLYIIMEKLIPLSPEEEKLFMTELSGLAYYYSEKGQRSRGEQLIDYITDRNGNIGIKFGNDMASALAKAIAKAPEYSHIKSNLQQVVSMISKGGQDSDAGVVMKAWLGSNSMDDVKFSAIQELYDLNSDFKKFLNGVSTVLMTQYKGSTPDEKITDEPDFLGMVMNSMFDIIFSQRYPMKYVKNPDLESPYETGHGQSSDIYDLDITPNPKIREQKEKYSAAGVKSNPAQKAGKKMTPQKYPFDNFISTIKRLGRDWNIQAKDMHGANVMKRANGEFVVADIGLFNTKIIQSMKSGIFETKRKIKVKII